MASNISSGGRSVVTARSKRVHPEGVPLVSSLSRAAELLALDPGHLAAAIDRAGLEPWPGRHADGSMVWPWSALVGLARQLGADVPANLAPERRGSLSSHQQRGRANRYQKASS
jgi:hypothetical protein